MPETAEWALAVTGRIKDRGTITFPPHPVGGGLDQDVVLKEIVAARARRTRTILGAHDTARVNLTVKFVPITTVAS